MSSPFRSARHSPWARARRHTDVVDEPAGGGEARVFVSEGMDVYRKRTLGSGADGDVDYTVSFKDGPTPQRLVFHREQGQVTGISVLAHDNDRTFLDALGSSAEPLMVESDEVVADLPLQYLPGEIVLEYLATLDEGGSEYTSWSRVRATIGPTTTFACFTARMAC